MGRNNYFPGNLLPENFGNDGEIFHDATANQYGISKRNHFHHAGYYRFKNTVRQIFRRHAGANKTQYFRRGKHCAVTADFNVFFRFPCQGIQFIERDCHFDCDFLDKGAGTGSALTVHFKIVCLAFIIQPDNFIVLAADINYG